MKFAQFQACFHRNFQEAGNSMPNITAGKIIPKMDFWKFPKLGPRIPISSSQISTSSWLLIPSGTPTFSFIYSMNYNSQIHGWTSPIVLPMGSFSADPPSGLLPSSVIHLAIFLQSFRFSRSTVDFLWTISKDSESMKSLLKRKIRRIWKKKFAPRIFKFWQNTSQMRWDSNEGWWRRE